MSDHELSLGWVIKNTFFYCPRVSAFQSRSRTQSEPPRLTPCEANSRCADIKDDQSDSAPKKWADIEDRSDWTRCWTDITRSPTPDSFCQSESSWCEPTGSFAICQPCEAEPRNLQEEANKIMRLIHRQCFCRGAMAKCCKIRVVDQHTGHIQKELEVYCHEPEKVPGTKPLIFKGFRNKAKVSKKDGSFWIYEDAGIKVRSDESADLHPPKGLWTNNLLVDSKQYSLEVSEPYDAEIPLRLLHDKTAGKTQQGHCQKCTWADYDEHFVSHTSFKNWVAPGSEKFNLRKLLKEPWIDVLDELKGMEDEFGFAIDQVYARDDAVSDCCSELS